LFQARRGVPRLLNQAMKDGSKPVRLALWILHRIAAQPAHKKDRRNLARGVLGPRNQHPQLVSCIILRPAVDHFSILESFPLNRRRGLGQQKGGQSE
jgi:hypothetical protein